MAEARDMDGQIRQNLKDAVHKNQQHVDCLEYLFYKLNKGAF